MIPAWRTAPEERWWRFTMLIPSTITLPSPGSTRCTLPLLPRSLPVFTSMVSLCRMWRAMLDHLRRQGYDTHVVLVPQLSGHRPKDPRSPWVVLVREEHGRVVIEPDVCAIGAAVRLRRPHHH